MKPKQVPYIFIPYPAFLAECDELTPQEKAVLLFLMSSTYRNWNPSYRELSAKLSLGNSTIKRAITKLRLLGFITASVSIHGETYKNKVNQYRVNFKNPTEWCPTLDLKTSIERCYEMNGSPVPIFSYVYLDNKTLAEDFEHALSTGEIRRTRAVAVDMVDKILSSTLPIAVRLEFEEKKFSKLVGVWRSCRAFIEWLEIKKDYLNGEQVEQLKNLFISENLDGERRTILRETLLTKTAAEFLTVMETEREKSQAERDKKLSPP